MSMRLISASLRKLLLSTGIILVASACQDVSQQPIDQYELEYFSTQQTDRCCLVIAHAAGAIHGNSYTNSIEALEANYALGTRIFEIDFSLTSDGHWVGAHDWKSWKRMTQFPGNLPPTLEQVLSLKLRVTQKSWSIDNRYSAISMTWLQAFLSDHPEAKIITDTKNLEEFPALVERVSSLNAADQFIYQAYSLADANNIKRSDPDAKIILTLYRMGMRRDIGAKVAQHSEKLIGVTLPMSWAYDKSFLKSLRDTDLPIYLHGSPANINSRSLHTYFAARGINGFYLD